MEMMTGIIDTGEAPYIHVDGIWRVSRPSANIIVPSYWSWRYAPDGRPERRAVAHFIWDRDVWFATLCTVHSAADMIAKVGPIVSSIMQFPGLN